EVYPSLRHRTNLVFEDYAIEKVRTSDLVFIALPSGEAMKIVPGLVDANIRVIDLGGDFRLQDSGVYQRYYKREHTAGDYLSCAVYGLPEWNREAISKAQLIANPGCYVTSALLPLLPLVKEGAIAPDGIIISSMSGVSGAGRQSSIDYSFTETNESVKAYKAGVHQHTPEIDSVLSMFTGARTAVTFVPHLIPITRGIHSSMYGLMAPDVTTEHVRSIYESYYAAAPFIRVDESRYPEIKHVQYTNYCDIGFSIHKENNRLMIFSVIDNLIKGAAGQAVQNMNIMFGYDETEGL
ncbi:MAG TPA: N-acetyl-gamma-glutamyl-phosphate reductase, partial [Bacteroidota bacterium]|nr:N-acetyl-gamma-glutamyl-phosphate reductase [Bacteroidota bacterium]